VGWGPIGLERTTAVPFENAANTKGQKAETNRQSQGSEQVLFVFFQKKSIHLIKTPGLFDFWIN